jgi:histidinol-phosphate aminotransferase
MRFGREAFLAMNTGEVCLDKNENPFDLPPSPREEIRDLLSTITLNRYPEPEYRSLREALAGYVNVDANQLIVGNGGDEILFLCFLAFVKPGDVVLRLHPSFSQYSHLIRVFGARERTVPVELDSRQGTFRIDEEALLDAVAASSPKLVLLDSPNNPTGFSMEPEFLARFARLSPCPVVLDEAYIEFGGPSVLDIFKKEGFPSHALVLRTLSKAWGLAGIRLGYSVSGERICKTLNDVRGPFNVNVLTQEIAKILLHYREWMESRVYSIRYMRDRFVESMARIPGWEAFPSDGNFVLLRTAAEERFARSLFERAGIRVKFLNDLPWEGTWLRITVGREEDMRAVLDECSQACVGGEEEHPLSASALA